MNVPISQSNVLVNLAAIRNVLANLAAISNILVIEYINLAAMTDALANEYVNLPKANYMTSGPKFYTRPSIIRRRKHLYQYLFVGSAAFVAFIRSQYKIKI